jgi:long-chain acyl-CoA synthetase
MKKVEKCSSFLMSQRLKPNSQGLVLCGILSKNKPEWLIFDIACSKLGITSVGLVENSSSDNLAEMIRRLEVEFICCDRANLLKLLTLNKERKTHLSQVFLMQKPDFQELHQAEQAKVKLDYYCSKSHRKENSNRYSEVFTLSLTSGVTGDIKICIISNKSFLSSILGADIPGLNLATRDIYLSYVPLALMWERAILYKILVSGASIAFTDINSIEFIDDIKSFKPTLTLGISKLLEKIYDGVQEKLLKNSKTSKALFNKALQSKRSSYQKSGNLKSMVYDKLVFKKVRQTLGGKMRLMISGSTLYRKDVIEYLRLVLSCEILQGYGSIETLVTCMCSEPGDNSAFHLGGPLAGYSFKLRKIKEFEILGLEGKVYGELYVKSQKLFSGYYKELRPVDFDGWYATGDVFLLNKSNLSFTFIDCLHSLFILNNQKAISIQKIELVCRDSRFVESIFATIREDLVVAVIVPNERLLREKLAPFDVAFQELCQSPSVISAVFSDINEKMILAGLTEIEKVKAIHLEAESWISEEMISPTLKLRRKNLENRYTGIIESLIKKVRKFD